MEARAGQEISGGDANRVMKAANRDPEFSTGSKVTFAELKLDAVPWYEVLLGIPEWRRTYYRSGRRRGEELRGDPRFLVSTIHAVKGGEADHVVILPDIPPRAYEDYLRDPDDELRVWYVGITRSRGDLHIVNPQGARYYPL